MKRATIAVAVLAMVGLVGCTSVPTKARLIPVENNGVGVGMDIGANAQDGSGVMATVQKHPILSVLGTAGAGFLGNYVYQRIKGDDKGDRDTRPVGTSVGDGNVIVTGDVAGDVRVNQGNTGE